MSACGPRHMSNGVMHWRRSRLTDMTITAIPRRTTTATESPMPSERLRCDLCGRSVIDPDAHLLACVEHEVALFVIGRAS